MRKKTYTVTCVTKKFGHKKPQYEEVPIKEIRTGVLYNDECQGLSLSGAPVSPSNYYQDF